MKLEQISAKPARWWTLLGLILVPLLIAGGFLIAGLNTSHRLGEVQAAIVNLDDPVTLNGKYVPMGRQLTANLIDSDRTENLTWVLDSEANARAGLATGSYAAMVVIPPNFSAAATSYAHTDQTASRATIELATSPVAGLADASLGKTVALAAADSLNQTLTSTYLENIYLGFNDMGTQFVTMSDGADQLATGAETIQSKTSDLPAGAAKLAQGTQKYVVGVNQLVDQNIAALGQQKTLAASVSQLNTGANGVANGLGEYQKQLRSRAAQSQDTATALQTLLVQAAGGDAAAAHNAVVTIEQACKIKATLATLSTDGPICVGSLTGSAQALTGAADGLSTSDPQTKQSLMSGAQAVAGGTSQLSANLNTATANTAATTAKLNQLKDGGNQISAGTSDLAAGMPALTSGISQLADGTRQMADGIAAGKDKLPSYTTSQRENLSDVVSAPISTQGLTGLAMSNLGWVSLLVVLALWLGALATFTVLKPIMRGVLGSAESNPKLIAHVTWPGLTIVGVQGVIMAGLAQLAWDLSWPKAAAVGGILLIAAVAFSLVNQALAAWAGGAGRLISVVFAVITTAAALAPAAPGGMNTLRALSPLTPALDAIRAVVTESGGATNAALVLVGWLLLGGMAVTLAVLKERTTKLSAVLAS